MSTIYLHGHLGEKYGERFDFSVVSVAEAIRLLSANFKGFQADLINYAPGFLVSVDGKDSASVDAIREHRLNPDIHIVPAIAGAGGDNSGIKNVIIGVLIVVAAYYGGSAGVSWLSSGAQSAMYGIGMNLVISGVSSMLFANSSNSQNEITGETELTSYAFNGPVNTIAQGNPVPVLYGRMMVGSQVISAGIETK